MTGPLRLSTCSPNLIECAVTGKLNLPLFQVNLTTEVRMIGEGEYVAAASITTEVSL